MDIRLIGKKSYKLNYLTSRVSLNIIQINCPKCSKPIASEFINHGNFKSDYWGIFELKLRYKKSYKSIKFNSYDFHRKYKQFGSNFFLLQAIKPFFNNSQQREIERRFNRDSEAILIKCLKYLKEMKVKFELFKINLTFSQTPPPISIFIPYCENKKINKFSNSTIWEDQNLKPLNIYKIDYVKTDNKDRDDISFMYESKKEGEIEKNWVLEEENEIKEGKITPFRDWK